MANPFLRKLKSLQSQPLFESDPVVRCCVLTVTLVKRSQAPGGGYSQCPRVIPHREVSTRLFEASRLPLLTPTPQTLQRDLDKQYGNIAENHRKIPKAKPPLNTLIPQNLIVFKDEEQTYDNARDVGGGRIF